MTSRVARNPIVIPSGVTIQVQGQLVNVKGKLGELSHSLHELVKISQEDKTLLFTTINESIESNALAGTSRALISNMVRGVSEGFEKKLVMVGVGYRAKVQGNTLELSVGFSHPVSFVMPDGVKVEVPSQTEIVLKGPNKELVSQIAANIRAVRPPEPYKGKGIRYENEVIIRKEGKKK